MTSTNSSEMPSASSAAGWRGALAVAAVGTLGMLLLYWPTVASIEQIWRRSGNFTHGYMIVPIAGYMLWTIRHELSQLTPRPAWLGLVLVVLGAVAWIMAKLVHVLVVEQLALVVMLQGIWLSIFGYAVYRAAFIPLAYVFFAVPFGQGLEPYLQEFTAWFSVGALRLTGIPVLWEGLYITIPTGAFEVAEACSGMRYLMASLALGILYAFLNYRSWRYRLAFIALSIVVPIVANGLRAYLIIMLAHLSNHRLAVGVDHIIYGWVFFGIIMYLLFRFAGRWREADSSHVSVPAQQPVAINALTYAIVALVAVVIGVAARPAYASLSAQPDNAAAYAFVMPPSIGAWQQLAGENPSWQPEFVGADIVNRGSYQRAGSSVEYLISFYVTQQQGEELGGGNHTLYRSKAWRRVSGQILPIERQNGSFVVKQTLVRSGRGAEMLLWHCYWVAGRYSGSAMAVKFMEIIDRLKGQRRGSAALVLATPVFNQNLEQARESLAHFLNEAAEPFNQALLSAKPKK